MPKILLIILAAILGIIFLLMVASLLASIQFHRQLAREVAELYRGVPDRPQVVQEVELAPLPPPVKKWLARSGVVGRERTVAVRTRQKVSLRLKEDGSWMSARVQQYFRVDEPGFIWQVRASMAPGLYFAGRDKYVDGRGHMLIRVLSLFKVADARGKEIDQGTMLRYLAETMWFPAAALSSYIKWEAVDDRSARAVMTWGGMTVSGVFTFNQQGDAVIFVGRRYGQFGGHYRLKTWVVQAGQHREFAGFRVPTAGEVLWKLEDGDFVWYRFTVEDIEYNKPVVY